MPPYNEEAEQAVLACMMNFEDKVDDVVTKVQPQDFHLPRHAVIFEACRSLRPWLKSCEEPESWRKPEALNTSPSFPA